jgi:hypothetical protein
MGNVHGTGPFSRYPVTGESVRGAADQIGAYGGTVQSLQYNVVNAHRPAQFSVAGLLTSPMVAASEPVRTRTERWQGSAMFSSGAVRLFADAIDTYNQGIDGLNQRYWTAKQNNFGVVRPTLAADATEAERNAADADYRQAVADAESALLAELRNEHHTVIEPALDDEAARTASLLDRGPDDADAVTQLYMAGALHWSAPLVFRNVDFSGLPSQVSGADGAEAAEIVQRAMSGDASPEEFQEAMLILQLVTNRASQVQEQGGYLSEGELAFLHEFYGTLGDDLWDLPNYIQRESHSWDAPRFNPFGLFDKDADGFDQDTQEWMLAASGTGLLALSNPQLWPPTLRSQDPMDTDSQYHLPQTVIDLVSDPAVTYEMKVIGYASYNVFDLPRKDDFLALADMLGAVESHMEGGTGFSEQLTLRMAEIAAPVQHFTDWTPSTPGLPPLVGDNGLFHEDADSLMRTLLGVSTRNDEANYHILTDQVETPLGAPSGRTVLTSLYHFKWSDDGATVAGLTDWISERADAAAQTGEHDPMATEAAAALIDLMTTTERGEGHNDPEHYREDMYDDMMRTLAEQNPEVARSFSRIAAAYLSDFSEPSGPTTGVENDGSLTLSDHDKIRFLDLIATDEQAINGLSYASGQYQQRLLELGLTDDVPMTEVAQRSSRLDGLLAAARVNAAMVGESQEYADAQAAYEEHMRYAGYGKSIVTSTAGAAVGASPLKPFSSFINGGLSSMADAVISGTIQAPTADQGFDPGDILDQGRDDTYAAYDYLHALNSTGQLPDDFEIPDQFIRYGPPYPGAPFETPMYENGRPMLKPINELHGSERQELINLIGNEDTGIGGEDFAVYRSHYNAADSFDSAAVQGLDRAEAHRQGLR